MGPLGKSKNRVFVIESMKGIPWEGHLALGYIRMFNSPSNERQIDGGRCVTIEELSAQLISSHVSTNARLALPLVCTNLNKSFFPPMYRFSFD